MQLSSYFTTQCALAFTLNSPSWSTLLSLFFTMTFHDLRDEVIKQFVKAQNAFLKVKNSDATLEWMIDIMSRLISKNYATKYQQTFP